MTCQNMWWVKQDRENLGLGLVALIYFFKIPKFQELIPNWEASIILLTTTKMTFALIIHPSSVVFLIPPIYTFDSLENGCQVYAIFIFIDFEKAFNTVCTMVSSWKCWNLLVLVTPFFFFYCLWSNLTSEGNLSISLVGTLSHLYYVYPLEFSMMVIWDLLLISNS